MRQPRAEMIAGAIQENLRLIFQAPKRARMNNAGPVALKFRAVIMVRLGIFPSARLAGFLRERREDSSLVRFHFFPRFPALARKRRATRIIRHNEDYSWGACFCESGVGRLEYRVCTQ